MRKTHQACGSAIVRRRGGRACCHTHPAVACDTLLLQRPPDRSSSCVGPAPNATFGRTAAGSPLRSRPALGKVAEGKGQERCPFRCALRGVRAIPGRMGRGIGQGTGGRPGRDGTPGTGAPPSARRRISRPTGLVGRAASMDATRTMEDRRATGVFALRGGRTDDTARTAHGARAEQG